jgi:hypothetical protein
MEKPTIPAGRFCCVIFSPEWLAEGNKLPGGNPSMDNTRIIYGGKILRNHTVFLAYVSAG